jgi:hypothetical protein
VEGKGFGEILDEARNANPVAFIKAEFAPLKKVFHPDPEHSTANPARKRQLTDAAAIFNAKKFRAL